MPFSVFRRAGIAGALLWVCLVNPGQVTVNAAETVQDGPLTPGTPLPALSLSDQFDQHHDVAACRDLLLFAPDRDSAGVAQDYLDARAAAGLDGVCYIADISGMPGVITRLFALPAMRDYAYPVLLGRTPADTLRLPRRAGQVTVLTIRAGSVDAIGFAATVQAIEAAAGGS